MGDVTAAMVVEQMARMMDGTWEYRFGAELGRPPNDAASRLVDCSEATEAAIRWAAESVGSSLRLTDGSFAQYDACYLAGTLIPLEQARRTPGALVWLSHVPDPTPGLGRSGVYHVGLVADPDTVYEACCSDGDTVRPCTWDRRAWISVGGLIPGVIYPSDKPVKPARRRAMLIYVRRPDGAVYCVSAAAVSRFGIASPADLAELQKATADPAHVADVTQKTYDALIKAVKA